MRSEMIYCLFPHLKPGQGENTEGGDVQLGQERLQLVLRLHVLRLLITDGLAEAEVHHSDVVVVVFVVVVNAQVHGHSLVGRVLWCWSVTT